jgi:hypothetical protein
MASVANFPSHNAINNNDTNSTPSSSSSSIHHVLLSYPRCQWKKGSISEYVSKARVFYDSLHSSITLFTGAPINHAWTTVLMHNNWMDFPIVLPSESDILGAQLSLDKSLLAVRCSEKEIKIVSTANGNVVTARSCINNNSRMISVHWIKPDHMNSSDNNILLFIQNAGIELYQLQANKLKHLKTAAFNVMYHWTLIEENILLLVDSKNVFQLYKLNSKNITKFTKFELDCNNTPLNPPQNGATFHREQVQLFELYGRLTIAFINERKGHIYLLSPQLNNPEEMEQIAVLDCLNPGHFCLSVIDNVLIVHALQQRVSLLFDIKTESKGQILCDPLPCGPANNNSGSAPFEPYVKWTFLPPNYVWQSTGDQQQGNFWSLALNFTGIAATWPASKRARLIEFLLRRRNSAVKELIQQICAEIIANEPQTSLSLLSRIFSMLNRVVYDYSASLPADNQQKMQQTTPLSSQSGYLIIPQAEIYQNVFLRAQTHHNLPPAQLIPLVVEYFRSLYRHSMRPSDDLNEFLVNLLISEGKLHDLHQFLQYHIIYDSVIIAEKLITLAENYVPAYQLGLDMLFRLNCTQKIIQILLSKGEIMAALKLVPNHRSNFFDLPGLQPKNWLQAAISNENHTIFYICYKFFEQRNILLRNSPLFAPSEECAPFIQLFLSYFPVDSDSQGNFLPRDEYNENYVEEYEADDPLWLQHVGAGKLSAQRDRETQQENQRTKEENQKFQQRLAKQQQEEQEESVDNSVSGAAAGLKPATTLAASNSISSDNDIESDGEENDLGLADQSTNTVAADQSGNAAEQVHSISTIQFESQSVEDSDDTL